MDKLGSYDVVVIGAGHAGIEAAHAAATLGARTAVFTLSLDFIGNMPCNPSIGGTAKGHLVREVDALGGLMGIAADATFLQSRMLNRGKGPAVHSLRVQTDRKRYHMWMKHALEKTPNLDIHQAEIVAVDIQEGKVCGIITNLNGYYSCKALVIATGTTLGGRIFVGEAHYDSGPDGTHAATALTKCLVEQGFTLRRFKTGTPARVLKSSIDFSGLQEQPGEDPVNPFSYDTAEPLENKAVCHISWTNEKTKQIILENIHRSPLYGGKIEGVGPRYCPSLEDKIVRFADKERHQLFIEPCGENTEEMYLQGMSSSLPEEVQLQFYHSIKGLEHCLVMRCAYAIEYDCVDPLQMAATLEFMDYPGLYGAGQFNGSSGYEEAAAQGLVAGMNAALKIKGREQVVLDRASSYIGTLIDDLVTKGVEDPYRMMTSRSEYRLVLRQDNADERLTPLGREIGLISDSRWNRFVEKQELKRKELNRLKKTSLPPTKELNEILVSRETSPVETGIRLLELLKRPQVDYACLAPVDTTRPDLDPNIFEQVEVEIKYEGYIRRQKSQIDEMRRLEGKRLPKELDYQEIHGISSEAQEKLNRVRPGNIGQASRISGVSPADISVLLIWLSQNGKAVK